MSVTFVLLPLALAAVATHKARQDADDAGHHVIDTQTRMRDPELLVSALDDLGWLGAVREGEITASAGDRAVTFTHGPDGVLQARFDADATAEEAEALLRDLDDEYTRLVQAAVYERVVARAGQSGMAVESEHVEADESIVVTLRVDG